MANRFYPSPRSIVIDGDNVEITVDTAPHALKRDMRNHFNKFGLGQESGMLEDIEIPAGLIEDLAVRRSLKKMVVGTREIDLHEGASPINAFPAIGMGDEDDEYDLYEEVLKTIVDANRFLAHKYPFNMVFLQYLQLVRQDEKESKDTDAEDPTKQENGDTSSVTRISGAELNQGTTSSEDKKNES